MTTNNSSNYSPTQYAVQVGGANGTLANISPSTAGIALVSAGASSNPTFSTVAIAGGGTNATTYTQTNGIVTYNGTSLVNYAGPQIDSIGRYTNSTQPAFCAYLNVSDNNVTGGGQNYVLGTVPGNPLVELYDIGNNFSVSTATFTAPVTGYYRVEGQIRMTQLTTAHNSGQILIITTSATYRTNLFSPGAFMNSASTVALGFSKEFRMTAGDTFIVQTGVGGGSTVVDISALNQDTYIACRLLS